MTMPIDRRAFKVGQSFEKIIVDDLKRTQVVQYAGASGDFNAVHTDEVYAREIGGFPGVFAHGMLTMAMTGGLLTDIVGVQNLIRFGGPFKAQVWPGDTLTATLTVVSVTDDAVEVSLRAVNQDRVEVFTASAAARVSGRSRMAR